MADPTPVQKQLQKSLIVLAALEMPVMAAAVFRFASAATETPAQDRARLIWFVACVLTASSAISVFMLRFVQAQQGARQAQDAVASTDDQSKQSLSFSIALIVLAGAMVAVGPGVVERLLG